MEQTKHKIQFYEAKIKRASCNYSFLEFKNISKLNVRHKNALKQINLLFSEILRTERPAFLKYTPYIIKVSNLVPKNQWTQGKYVAINNGDGTLDLQLAFKKIEEMPHWPIYNLLWVMFHEFRHKIQLYEKPIDSVIKYPNLKNFNEFMQKTYGVPQDLIDHVFHELNPDEVDANVFASELTGLNFMGNAFDINDQTLSLLGAPKKQSKVKGKLKIIKSN